MFSRSTPIARGASIKRTSLGRAPPVATGRKSHGNGTTEVFNGEKLLDGNEEEWSRASRETLLATLRRVREEKDSVRLPLPYGSHSIIKRLTDAG